MYEITCEATGNVYTIHQADPRLVPPGSARDKWYFCPSRFTTPATGKLLNEPHDYGNAYDTAEQAEAAARLCDAQIDRSRSAARPGSATEAGRIPGPRGLQSSSEGTGGFGEGKTGR